ncbi:MAG: CTP synthase [Firmicutes bacterium]|nr:CTP synthase [Bacillota bacterium]
MGSKFIFVTGGVVSSIGKGITSASLGRLLKSRDLKITIQKFDPYINVDAGTMNPYQHGEVFVTEDGAETDLDLGHYERFIDENLHQDNNVTTGKIYGAVIAKERKGEYLGDTVKVIPHVTNQIKEEILKAARDSQCDIAIVEVGGTVGDIEGQPFLEAIRQLKNDLGEGNVLYIHVTLVPHIGAAGELKTKPTQHSVKELRGMGIQPDIIVCRTEKKLTSDVLEKIALYCDVEKEAIMQSVDAPSIYEVPLMLEKQHLSDLVMKKLRMISSPLHLQDWEEMVSRIQHPEHRVTIALVGKYVQLKDAYISISEALTHGGISNRAQVEIKKIDAEFLQSETPDVHLRDVDGILVPGGFGGRGLEGKILAIQYARENRVPYFGICYGMQCATVEYARNVAGWKKANTTEADLDTPYPVISLLAEQHGLESKGGTMRLGAYACRLKKGSKAYDAYGEELIYERHRHRYEFNNIYLEELMNKGLVVSGMNPERNLVEIIEIADHPWFVATQFHPEFKSRPNRAHPLYRDFIRAAVEYRLMVEGKTKAVSAHQ